MTSTERTVIVGTRGSDLALRQTQEVVDRLLAVHPNVRFQVSIVSTHGDNRPSDPIERLGVGAFVKELEIALLRGDIDLAVHSLKDLPTSQPEGLEIAAVTRREDPRDALVNRWGLPLDRLPSGARIGTSSPRRSAQLRHLRPDLQMLPIRGAVPTRLEKARGADFDGAVVAMAGLRRLGLEHEVSQVFEPEVMVPAPGQGALALEIRQEDRELAALVHNVHDPDTAAAVRAERALLMNLGSGCLAPFGAYATVAGDTLTLTGILEVDTQLYKVTASGSVRDPVGTAAEAYGQLVNQGATRSLGIPKR